MGATGFHQYERWRSDEVERLKHLCINTKLTAEEIAAEMAPELGRTDYSIIRKIRKLGLRRRQRGGINANTSRKNMWTRPINIADARPRDDGRFAAAVTKAAAAGLEHPPMIGVDKRPCTKRPVPYLIEF